MTVGLRAEKAYEKYAWILPLIWGLIVVVIGSVQLSMGYTGSTPSFGLLVPASAPADTISTLNTILHGLSFVVIFLGLSFVLVSATGFRSGEKWAWYFVLLWTAFFVIGLISFSVAPTQLYVPLPPIIGLPLLLIGLYLPIRKFFPKKAQINT